MALIPKRWPLSHAWFWQEAPFFRLLLPLLAGILCYDHQWLSLRSSVLTAGLWLIPCLLIPIAGVRRRSAALQAVLFILLQVLIFLVGLWRCQVQDMRRDDQWFGNSRDSFAAHLVRVLEPPAARERVWRMRVGIIGGMLPGHAARPLAGEAFLMVYKGNKPWPVKEGDTLLVPARWQPVANSGNPGEFDYQAFCRRRNILHQQLVRQEEVVLVAPGNPQAAGWIDRLHTRCDRQLRRYLSGGATLGLLQAMLLGDESNFDPALRQAYSDTGVVHIVSISGSHVAVLFLIVTSLLFWIRGRHGQWIRYGAGLALVWIYVVMAGAPPSAVRSAMMFSVLAVGATVSREPQPLNTLLAAAFILLCGNPMWLFAIGFQLSFAAVLSLLLFYRPLYRLWPQTTRAGRWLWKGAAASFAAEVLTAPLVVYYFHNFPLFFLPANLLAAGVIGGGVLIGGMAIVSLSFLPPVARGIAFLTDLLTGAFNRVIYMLQSWNPPSFRYLLISGPELLLIYLVIAGLSLFLLRGKKWGLFTGLGAGCLLLLCLCLDKAHSLRQQRLVVFNISRQTWIEQVRGAGHQVLYSDTALEDHYIARQTRTAWDAWQAYGARAAKSSITIGRKRVLLLDRDVAPGVDSFPVDVLILERPMKGLSPSRLRQVFHPGIVVAGGGQPRWLVQQWKDSCRLLHMPFHAVGIDGAFVLE